MIILKQNSEIIISTDYHHVTKQALTSQATIELQHEYRRYQYYKDLQGTFLPIIYGITTNELRMEYCPGAHTAANQHILDARKYIISLHDSTNTIDRKERQRLIDPALVQKILTHTNDIQQSNIIKQLVREIINILHTEPVIPTSYCHGDLQSHNIIQHDNRITLIDPKPVWMHYTYDLMYYAVCENLMSESISLHCDHHFNALIMLHCIVLRKIHVYTHAGEYRKIGPLLDTYVRIRNALNI